MAPGAQAETMKPEADLTEKTPIQEVESMSEPQADKLITKENISGPIWFWALCNIVATVGVVFTNKAIFSAEALRGSQIMLAAYHFLVTWAVLFAISRPRFEIFAAKMMPIADTAPLAIATALNVAILNLSLAFSSVTLYQMARILLTPCVAGMNYFLYRITLKWSAMLSLVPACAGVGMLTYFESIPTTDTSIKKSTRPGVLFTFSGVFVSSLYTVWIGRYHHRLQVSTLQLLYSQAPVSAFFLLLFVPLIDNMPTWGSVSIDLWILILASGVFAPMVNISQFFVIAHAGAVSSTVVGHAKTCIIVTLGWMFSGRPVGDMSLVGTLLALSGIIAYSITML